MSGLILKPYIRRVFLGAFLMFLANKFAFRPLVLESESPTILQSVVLSLPNTIEAIMGTTIVTAILTWAQRRFRPRFDHVPKAGVALLGTLIAGVYVLTQEFKWHDLGGRNVFDPNDVAGSLVGLVLMLVLLSRFGVFESNPVERSD